MCGICGASGPVPTAVLEAMTSALTHRGPDDQGYYQDQGASLGMRRLSIIDLEGGHQPLGNESRSAWVVLNGEIYNYRQLRSRLRGRHRMATASDTEVIVHLYEEYGDACVHALRGMFAFALWDVTRQRLLLARDRLGEKPLYYWQGAGQLVFGSEIKAILEHPGVVRAVDQQALHLYLALGYVPDPWTLFAGIHKLPPGHTLVWEDHRLVLSRYWDLSLLDPPREVGMDEAARELRARVDEATRMRLVADVPVGALLSGGLDSSAVVSGMAAAGPVRTFTVGFDVDGYNEFAEARAVAERYGTEHCETVLHALEVPELLPKVLWHLDEPVADAAALPTYQIAQFARQSVKVVLTGEGADEVFGGYPRYGWFGVSKKLEALPAWMRSLSLQTANRALPAGGDRARKAGLLLEDLTDQARHLHWVGAFTRAEREALMVDPGGAELPEALVSGYLNAHPGASLTHRLMYLDLKSWLTGDVLMKVDRMSMAVGLEARAPFLDHELVEFVATLPPQLKVGRGGTKHVLRAAFADLPEVTTGRRKHAFQVPVGEWFRDGLRDYLMDTLLAPGGALNGVLRPEAIRALVAEHMRGQADHGRGLWVLLCLEVWHRLFIDRPAR